MSYVLVAAEDIHYGPTTLSTEDSLLHQQIGELNISTSTRSARTREDKSAKVRQKLELKLKELKDKPEKQEKLKEKIDRLVAREGERVGVVEGKKVKFDPNARSIVIKVEDAPVRVLNKLVTIGYTIVPASSGGNNSRFGHVWTLFRAGYMPQMIYPELNNLNIH